jgi:hypothetical protein
MRVGWSCVTAVWYHTGMMVCKLTVNLNLALQLDRVSPIIARRGKRDIPLLLTVSTHYLL